MDLGDPLVEYGDVSIDVAALRAKILEQPQTFWEIDLDTRTTLAGDRPGNAVFFYNDNPSFIHRNIMRESRSGTVNVLRYKDRPLFAEIQELIEKDIQPNFPDCDVMRVQLAELPPGEVIPPHRDRSILAEIHRLHVPFITHEDVQFYIARESFFLEEGKLYDLNNVAVHSVENNSDVMRIHLLVDMLPHYIARASYHDTEEAMEAGIDGWQVSASA